ncbi:hypothetical protein BS78_01G142800 [Paspalum vaginatum]|nr:hypothetical protein BS78_01G142800 [Paspalum vaginatum]
MGAVASSSSPPPPLQAPTSDRPTPPPETAAPRAKEDPQDSAAAAAAAASADAVGGGADDAADTVVLDASAVAGGSGEGEEEQGECGFCLFMKGGGCEEEFVAWEKCVEDGEAAGGDVVERCQDTTLALRKCMDAHADYYEPILRAERAMAADLEAFKAQEAASDSTVPSPASEEGHKKQAPSEAAPPPSESEEGQRKQVADAAASERESRDLAA